MQPYDDRPTFANTSKAIAQALVIVVLVVIVLGLMIASSPLAEIPQLADASRATATAEAAR